MDANSRVVITNPRRRIIDDLRQRNTDHMHLIAGEYFGAQYSYEQTFNMFEQYKRAFIALDGTDESSITISAPSTIASVNAIFGAIDANKVVNLTPPGFLYAYTEKYTKLLGCKTVFLFEGFLNDELICKLHRADVKNVIITRITDYMSPSIRAIGEKMGTIKETGFIDEYIRNHGAFPKGMKVLSLSEFLTYAEGVDTYDLPYEENKLCARFLTGASTSQYPKCVFLSADGITKMASIYDYVWFPKTITLPKVKLGVFIPLYYATGAIHGIYGGLLCGMHMVYKPKYDRFTFGKDLSDDKIEVAVVAPSHVAALESSGLSDGSLKHVKGIFIGGEAVHPSQMTKFRASCSRLGISNILNGYGMTETGSMSGISDPDVSSVTWGDSGDVSISPLPGIEYRIIDPDTGALLSDNQRGMLQVKTPCTMMTYLEKEKNQSFFADDGWINTGDIACRYSNGRYRVFGRCADFFVNNGKKYAMFDIEEKVLEFDSVAEAEVIKFSHNDNEYPAIVVVLKKDSTTSYTELVKQICSIVAPGMEYLFGVKIIDNFKTNPITFKRDYLSLQNDTSGFYVIDKDGTLYSTIIGEEIQHVTMSGITEL